MSKIDLYKITRPNINPPTEFVESDFRSSVEQLANKFSVEQTSLMPVSNANYKVLHEAYKGIMMLILGNFESISRYMDEVIYCRYNGGKAKMESDIKQVVANVLTVAWRTGWEININDPLVAKRFQNRDSIKYEEIPSKEVNMLLQVCNQLYYMPGQILTDYYASPYGKRTSQQKEAHLATTYQTMMVGVMACFLEGIQSE